LFQLKDLLYKLEQQFVIGACTIFFGFCLNLHKALLSELAQKLLFLFEFAQSFVVGACTKVCCFLFQLA
jgi:hypothetical protein